MKYKISTFLDLIVPSLKDQIEYALNNKILSISLRIDANTTEKDIESAYKLIKKDQLFIMDLEIILPIATLSPQSLLGYIEANLKFINLLNPDGLILPFPYLDTDAANDSFKHVLIKIENITKRKVHLIQRDLRGTSTIGIFLEHYKLIGKVGYVFEPYRCLQTNESIITTYRIMKKFISNIRINDITKEGDPVLIGQGDTECVALFKKIIRDNYAETITLDSTVYGMITKINQIDRVNPIKNLFQPLINLNKNHTKIHSKYSVIKKVFDKEEITYSDLLKYQLDKIRQIYKN